MLSPVLQPNILGIVSLLGEALLAGCSAQCCSRCGKGRSSSQTEIFTSHENQAQGIVGLAFKTQDSDSSEHFTKSH